MYLTNEIIINGSLSIKLNFYLYIKIIHII